jgi:hypothetical protein
MRGCLQGYKVTAGWRKLHNEELRDLYSSPSTYNNNDQVEDEMGGACSTNGGQVKLVYVLVGKPEGKRVLERQRRWGGWIILRLDVLWTGLDWFG